MLFAGFATGSIFFPRLADKKGRKKVIVSLMGIQTVCFSVIFSMPGGE
jgi:MFS family permease